MSQTQYVVLDAETLGLDEKRSPIVEIAAIALDANLNPRGTLATFHRLVHTPGVNDRAWLDAHADPAAVDMHARSGLLDELKAYSGQSIENVTTDMLAWLSALGVDVERRNSLLMVGNNPSFDRKFINQYMQPLTSCLHYRDINVSSLRETAAVVLGITGDRLKSMMASMCSAKEELVKKQHRALGDVHFCLNELHAYGRMMAFGKPGLINELKDAGEWA